MIMGSQSDRVLHRASIPVLTFRALISADPAKQQAAKKAEATVAKV